MIDLYPILTAAGLALILRKLLNVKIRGVLADALACDVCSGFWSSLIVFLIKWPSTPLGAGLDAVKCATLILTSTAVVALFLRIYNRIDPGPVTWLEDDSDETDHTKSTH